MTIAMQGSASCFRRMTTPTPQGYNYNLLLATYSYHSQFGRKSIPSSRDYITEKKLKHHFQVSSYLLEL